ncbi:MAG: FAD-binding oxidoreductase [Bacteroidetes bacterium]|nr:FAD-binding oxidoreductase [Bacteroidota bacterium]
MALHPLSFWEHDSFLNYDFIVIGGGIIGLSTAISLYSLAPNASIIILERGIFPSGASTKNAGFACFGSLTEILSDCERIGEDATLDVIEKRWKGLEILRKRLGDTSINYGQNGGYELLFEEQKDAVDKIDYVNSLLHPLFGQDVFTVQNPLINEFGFNQNKVHSLIKNPFEGQIHSGMMMKSLAKYASERSIEILTGIEVQEITDDGDYCTVRCHHGAGDITFRAGKTAVCTNAFVPRLLPEYSIKPGRGQVLITAPIDSLKFKGVFHFDEGFYYFRNIKNRVLFGGGRNLDFVGEESRELATSYLIQNQLEELLHTVILPDTPFEIEYRWAGIMGFSSSKLPIVQKSSPNIAVGFGCNGMGVALGSETGRETAELLIR